MAKETGKKKFTAEEALMLLCSKDYSWSDLSSSDSSNSDDEENVDKLSQISSVSSDENIKITWQPRKNWKYKLLKRLNMIMDKY